MNAVKDWRLLVSGLGVLPFKDFGFVEELMMKAEDTLVLVVSWEYRRSHSC